MLLRIDWGLWIDSVGDKHPRRSRLAGIDLMVCVCVVQRSEWRTQGSKHSVEARSILSEPFGGVRRGTSP